MSDLNRNAISEMAARVVFTMALIAASILLAIAFSGCRTIEVTKEVPVITEHTTVQHHTDIVRDTLYQRDSVYHYVMGDTVIIERWHQAIKINKVAVSDTVRDTIPKVVLVTRTEIKEVNRLHWWQKVLMFAGIVCIAAGAGWLVRKLG